MQDPFHQLSEFNTVAGGDIWFALDEDRSLAFFAGIWIPKWTSVRKVKEGQVVLDLDVTTGLSSRWD